MEKIPYQIIEHDGKPAYVLVPYEDYQGSLKTDEQLLDEARTHDTGTRYPHDVTWRLVNGDNPIKVIREWKGLSQADLADKAGVSVNFISMLETGRRPLTAKTALALAHAMAVDADVLLDME